MLDQKCHYLIFGRLTVKMEKQKSEDRSQNKEVYVIFMDGDESIRNDS